MSEAKDATPEKTPGTAVAVRERLIVQAPVAIWDTADFEQMQRVAVVLTRSGLVPETLCKEKDEWLPEAVVAARCTLICNQARLWGADPLNVLQCTSLINGRLMYEGKLIAAVVSSMTGVKLRYKFGVWNTDHIEFPEDESGLHGMGERLAIRCFDPDDESRFVDGSVGLWKTSRKGNPWENANNWPRQLRYRASREWARAYEPGVILGILADGDQDIDELVIEAKPVGLMQRLKGEQEGNGFHAEQVEAQTGGKRTRKKKDTAPDPEPEQHMHATHEGDGGADQKASPHNPTADASDESVQEPPEIEHVEADVSEKVPEPNTSYAAPGEIYLLAEDRPNDQGRQLTYIDGVRHSSVMNPETSKLRTYAAHAPEKPEDDIPEHMRDENAPMTVEDAQIEAAPVVITSEAEYEAAMAEYEPMFDAEQADGARFQALGAAIAAWEEKRPRPTEEVMVPLTEKDEAAVAELEAEAAEDDMPADFAAYIDTVEAAQTWDQVKTAMREFMQSETWRGFSPSQQNKVRANTAEECFAHVQGLPDHADDVTMFRIWIEAADDLDAIVGTKRILEQSDQWKAVSDATRAAINQAVDVRLAAFR